MEIDRKRRALLVAGLLGGAGTLSGCGLTRALFKDREYEERFSSILITEDGRQLAVLGEKHHYLFEAPPVIPTTLKAPFREYTRLGVRSFHVDRNNRITGHVILTVDERAPTEARAAALAAGFVESTGQVKHLRYPLDLVGTRYRAGDDRIQAVAEQLSRPYEAWVTAKISSAERATYMALSPITLTADAALIVIGTTLMVPIGALLFVYILSN